MYFVGVEFTARTAKNSIKGMRTSFITWNVVTIKLHKMVIAACFKGAELE